MAETYSYRPYNPGDETAINDLYYKVTGRRRTAAQFAWQWLEAPEGQGDMWLIEATDEKGNVKLIGHHGVMPIAFSQGEKDLLFGKTENTMVLPEYRKKILYPRFEKKFNKAYEGRYDALFSTMGPAAAIRQRKVMGYEFPVEWHTDRYATNGLTAEFIFAGRVIANKLFKKYSDDNGIFFALVENGFITENDAVESTFFDGFWDDARLNFSIAPSRSKKFLTWRFWKNPYKKHLTFILDEGGVRGYCIISLLSIQNREAFLEDFCVQSNSPQDAKLLLNKMKLALRSAGVYSLLIVCTKDSALYDYGFIKNKGMFLNNIYNKIKNQEVRLMPRKMIGNKTGIKNIGWDVTGILLEGRA